MYITSLVHTFPFITMNIMMGEMELEYRTSPWYWSGVAALVPQTFLVLGSWGFMRNSYYETFKKLHFIAAAIFMAALFIHCNFRLTSWDFFWATAAIYGTVYFFRIGRALYNSGLGLKAEVSLYPDEVVRVSVPVPPRMKWTPGQHIFIRFLDAGLHAFTSHPFTIASLRYDNLLEGENQSIGKEKSDSESGLESGVAECGPVLGVFFRVKGGSTRSLAQSLVDHAGWARVLVDGPYGGVPLSLDKFDTVLLLSGGIGSTFTLPLAMDLVRKIQEDKLDCRIHFVVIVKKKESLAWMSSGLAIAVNAASKSGHELIDLRIHVTQAEGLEDQESETDNKKLPMLEEYIHPGRPKVSNIVLSACRGENRGAGRVAVVGCGPDSLLYDTRNAVAAEQLKIAGGSSSCHELFLHTEHYGW